MNKKVNFGVLLGLSFILLTGSISLYGKNYTVDIEKLFYATKKEALKEFGISENDCRIYRKKGRELIDFNFINKEGRSGSILISGKLNFTKEGNLDYIKLIYMASGTKKAVKFASKKYKKLFKKIKKKYGMGKKSKGYEWYRWNLKRDDNTSLTIKAESNKKSKGYIMFSGSYKMWFDKKKE